MRSPVPFATGAGRLTAHAGCARNRPCEAEDDTPRHAPDAPLWRDSYKRRAKNQRARNILLLSLLNGSWKTFAQTLHTLYCRTVLRGEPADCAAHIITAGVDTGGEGCTRPQCPGRGAARRAA